MIRVTSRLIASLTLLFAVAVLNAQTPGQAGDVFKIVKYDGLAKEVIKHRDKVVLVEFWATD